MQSGNLTVGAEAKAHRDAIQNTIRLIDRILGKIHREQRTIKDCKFKDREARVKVWHVGKKMATTQHTRLTTFSEKLDEELETLDDSIGALALALLPQQQVSRSSGTKLPRMVLPRAWAQ